MTTEFVLPHADLLQARNTVFLSGPFGAGKTTGALARIRWLLGQERIRGDHILVLTPQRSLARPYLDALTGPDAPPGPPVRVTTFAGLARNAVALYWPLIAGPAGFADPSREPTFLDLETAQYHMQGFVDAAFQQGEFDAIRVAPGRVVSQVLDNLNKAALHDFSIDEAYRRLELSAPQGPQLTARLNVLRAAQRISHAYRQLCLEQSLVDFSLWVSLFNRHVLTNEWSRTHLFRSHRHLIMDNAEEDTFAAHSLVEAWLPHLESALVIADDDAGYRVFLGAAPDDVARLADACQHRLRLEESHVTPPAFQEMARRVQRALRPVGRRTDGGSGTEDGRQRTEDDETAGATGPERLSVAGASPSRTIPLHHHESRFYPQMLDWAAGEIRRLVQDEGVSPGAIVVLAPFISDALRFSLQTRLGELGVPSTTHRPSRALRAEPAARALLTLAALAHPDWQIVPPLSDVIMTLGLSIRDLDPVRAHLLGQAAYRVSGPQAGQLQSFTGLRLPVQQRVTFRLGERYDRLRTWLEDYRAETEFTTLDQFFARLFGEVLSQPGFGFHADVDAARTARQLTDSARRFRWAVEDVTAASEPDARRRGQTQIGKAYVALVESGALGAFYAPGWQEADDAVLIAPAYTYLMRNRPVDIQFWLDIGATGWWERLFQPLTHPYVLSNAWPANAIWTDYDEYTHRQDTLRRLVVGLARRARREIYLGLSDYGESGMEQRGPLLALLNRVLSQ
ncbi:MAG: hypothetical protein D6790_18175, partial [Caldilineae bacterium]